MQQGQEFPFKCSKLTLFSGGISAVTAAAAATTGPNSLTSFASLSSSPLRWTVWNIESLSHQNLTPHTPHLTWSAHQRNSIMLAFSKSRILSKSVFLHTCNLGLLLSFLSVGPQRRTHLTVSWFLCSSASNAWGEVEGASSTLCQLKKPFRGPLQRELLERT